MVLSLAMSLGAADGAVVYHARRASRPANLGPVGSTANGKDHCPDKDEQEKQTAYNGHQHQHCYIHHYPRRKNHWFQRSSHVAKCFVPWRPLAAAPTPGQPFLLRLASAFRYGSVVGPSILLRELRC